VLPYTSKVMIESMRVGILALEIMRELEKL